MVKASWRGSWYEILAALLSLMSGDGACYLCRPRVGFIHVGELN